ncbi:MAG: phosphoribosylamine--glycine ligase [Alphaproteobacteria bacterium]|nr:phosphoribosylamine--glycine ligase [Alphaproteobacteria bacterium]
MKVLLIGGGGREHALGWKIRQSPLLSNLYVQSGNPGLNQIGEPVEVNEKSHGDVRDFCERKDVDLVVIGPETPLADGLSDALADAGIPAFGPSQTAAQLETSKGFTKEVCAAAGAPTAAYGRFTEPTPAKDFLRKGSMPYVIKADGLAAGKGVVICESLARADRAVDEILGGQFGPAGASIVIEEFLPGEEASFFVITDGERIAPLIGAQDHKRAFDGDQGPNTGGMGAYSPTPVFSPDVQQKAIDRIVAPTLSEMRRRGAPFRGVLYAGLMIENGDPRLIEYNVRFGDPECQVLMRRMRSDILPLLHGAALGNLPETPAQWSPEACALVVLAANGYPGEYKKGSLIDGVENADAMDGVVVFHAGTRRVDGRLLSNGGRVLNVTATAGSLREAVERAYAAVDAINWPDGFCRRDIAYRALGATHMQGTASR